MSKFNSRVNRLNTKADKLFRKIHIFISKKDFSLIKDYSEHLLEESRLTPEKAQSVFAQINKLMEEYPQNNDPDFQQKQDKFKENFVEITEGNGLVMNAYVYYEAIKKYAINYPDGTWLLKKDAQDILKQLQKSKDYLNRKKEVLRLKAEIERTHLREKVRSQYPLI